MTDVKPASAYLDANVYLGFYTYTEADLTELEKLEAAAKDGRLQLFLPSQTADEVARNREKVIAEAVKQFGSERLSPKVPLLMSRLPEAAEYSRGFSDLERKRGRLLASARELAGRHDLH